MGITLNEYFDASQDENGEVIGVVVDNASDPKQLGRVRVRIKGYTDDENGIPTDDLPWVTTIVPTNTGTPNGVSLVIPALDTKVMVKKVGGDDYTWKVVGQMMTTNHPASGWLQGDYPETWGMKDKTGTGVQINMLKENAYFLHVSQTDCNIDKAGATKINIRDWLNIYVESYTKIQIDEYLDTTINLHENRDVGLTRKTKIGENEILRVQGFNANEVVGYQTNLVSGEYQTNKVVGFQTNLVSGDYQTNEVTGYQTNLVSEFQVNLVSEYQINEVTEYQTNKVSGYQTNLVSGDYQTNEVSGYQTNMVGEFQTEDITGLREITVGDSDTLTVNGDVVITSIGGQINITAIGDIVLTAPTITVNGLLKVNGAVDVSGAITSVGEISSGGTHLSTHTHSVLSKDFGVTGPAL